MGDDAAARAHAAGGVARKIDEVGAAPTGLGGREMGADVAVAERAIDRVGERVQADVGVGMAGEARVVRNAHAAEPDVVAGREGVDVEALADADVSRRVEQPRFGGAEVFHGRHLHVRRIAVEDIGLMSRPGGDRRVVGQAVDAGGGGAPVRVEDQRRSGTPAASAPRARRRGRAWRRRGPRRRSL